MLSPLSWSKKFIGTYPLRIRTVSYVPLQVGEIEQVRGEPAHRERELHLSRISYETSLSTRISQGTDVLDSSACKLGASRT